MTGQYNHVDPCYFEVEEEVGRFSIMWTSEVTVKVVGVEVRDEKEYPVLLELNRLCVCKEWNSNKRGMYQSLWDELIEIVTENERQNPSVPRHAEIRCAWAEWERSQEALKRASEADTQP